MTRGLEKIDWSKVLFFDIETAAGQETITEDDEIWPMVSKKYKYKKDKDGNKIKRTVPEIVEFYKEDAGLHPALCKIVCISVGYIHGSKIRVQDITEKTHGDEAGIIRYFYKIANGRILGGHNVKRFDMPIIRMRALKNRIITPMAFSEVGLKPWEIGLERDAIMCLIDSMDLLRGSYSKNISLGECCEIANVPTPKDDISGEDVSSCYYNGEIDRIAVYCGKDTVASANLILALGGVPWLEQDTEYGTVVETSLAEQIFAAKEISEEDKRALKILIGKKKLTKKDKGNLREMLAALIIYTPFMAKGDSKDDIARKEGIINDFIKTI
jgi:predicted PolB exonuclease-like 3'-5' exonuclease